MSFKESASHFSDGFVDAQQGIDNSFDKAFQASTEAAIGIGTSVASAALAGAGSLTGYAGMASAVSSLGLGGVTTAIAGATAVVTAAVGGPLAMGAILVGGTGAAAYGVYQLGSWLGEQMR